MGKRWVGILLGVVYGATVGYWIGFRWSPALVIPRGEVEHSQQGSTWTVIPIDRLREK